MILVGIGILEGMKIRMEQHKKEYGQYPKRIYLSKEHFEAFNNMFPFKHWNKEATEYFRGVRVFKLT